MKPAPPSLAPGEWAGMRVAGRLEAGASRTHGAGDKRDHDQECAKGGDLGDVAQGVKGDGMHFSLLDRGKFMICSLYVHVKVARREPAPVRESWLTQRKAVGAIRY